MDLLGRPALPARRPAPGAQQGRRSSLAERATEGALLALVAAALCAAGEWGGLWMNSQLNAPGRPAPGRRQPAESRADQTADPTQVSFRPGEFHFRLGGRQAFLLGRNPTGWEVQQFAPLLQWAGGAGERMVRLHLTAGMVPSSPAGEVDEQWARSWERVFDMAAENGLCVLPVFAVWADWNDGSQGEHWHYWHRNPYNAAQGGPGRAPAELFEASECQELFLKWLAKLVTRWQARGNIMAWEVFSELDLVTGSSEARAVEFVERTAAVVRNADARHRPITVSLSGLHDWPRLWQSNAVDLVQVHPYSADLDQAVISSVRRHLERYGKPVLIGECGLSAAPPDPDSLTMAARASVGIRHAIWASAVSGAMNGRMLWWEDGYDQYHQLDLRTRYRDACTPVARFLEGVEFEGFRPLEATISPGLKGAAIGNERCVLGWFRDASCTPPEWAVRPVRGASVSIETAGKAQGWRVEFHETTLGHPLSAAAVSAREGKVTVALPPFEGSIAIKMRAEER